MTHPTEEQLVLYFYGESDETRAVADHLAECPACREDFALMQRTLNAVAGLNVPERGPGYGGQVWQRIAPQIRPRVRFFPQWLAPRSLAAVAAMACLLVVAFLVGRWPLQTPRETATAPGNAKLQNRLLLVNLTDHLERSKMVLVQLANSSAADMPSDQARAEDLLAANRLYRQSARMNGQPPVEDLLDDLEQFLTEVSNAGPDELSQLKQRMAEQDILFKLRIVDAQLRERQKKSFTTSSD
jgi:hypothetical protein